ncbi:MAG: hypothetical protein C4305_06860, partial [Thermoleophilia bacterium]
NVNGHRTVLGVRAALLGQDCRPAWYQVQLPLWPNGTIGYVRAGDVAVYTVSTRIEVDLSRRTLTFYRRGHPRLRVSAGIGAPRAASHGCIRLRDDVLRRLFRFTPAGTPVVIHA